MSRATRRRKDRRSPSGGLTLAALGVVFGDIGTSPLYATQAVFAKDAARPVQASTVAVAGTASLIVWTLVVIVLVKYVLLILRADNDGEGGIMALVSLITRERQPGKGVLVVLGIGGAALFFGDSLITPAISVLSAVEGMELVDPALKGAVVPIALVILVGLFALQPRGTGAVGRLFGPVMLLWFVVIGALGLAEVLRDPAVLTVLWPGAIVDFFAADGLTAFLALGAVVLAITGAEALYADLGHFGARPIRRAWLRIVFPALVLSYLGQAALLRRDPAQAAEPFFGLVPRWALLPVVVLATMATVIASQAVISGAFSLSRQASRLSYLPDLEVRETSETGRGQVYVPFVNRLLLIGVVALVFVFGSSARLASAYGVAVVGTMTLTAILFFARAATVGRWPRWQVLVVGAPVLAVDVIFLVANLPKVPTGGWLPLTVGAVGVTVMLNWRAGRRRVERLHEEEGEPVTGFVAYLQELGPRVRRVPGTAVFLTRPGETTPPALRSLVERLEVLPTQVLVTTVETLDVPHVAADERVAVEDLGFEHDGIVRVRVHVGYHELLDLPAVLREHFAVPREGITATGIDDATYFVSRTLLRPGSARGRARITGRLYLLTARAGTDPVAHFGLPAPRTLVIGTPIDLPSW